VKFVNDSRKYENDSRKYENDSRKYEAAQRESQLPNNHVKLPCDLRLTSCRSIVGKAVVASGEKSDARVGICGSAR